jgi:hypothetical protein
MTLFRNKEQALQGKKQKPRCKNNAERRYGAGAEPVKAAGASALAHQRRPSCIVKAALGG